MFSKWEFYFSRNFGGDHIEMYGSVKEGDRISYAKNVLMETKGERDYSLIDPFLRLSYDDCQTMMDALWDVGIRPSNGSGSAGQLAATEKHLDDMRNLTFNLINKQREEK